LGRFTQWDTYAGDIKNPISLNHYIYCYQDPVGYRDSTGNIPIETVLDIVSIGVSADDFFKAPSLENGLYLAWDIGATVLPYLPGSYTVKGLRLLNHADNASDIAKAFGSVGSIADAAAVFQKNHRSIIGSYSDVKKLVKSLGVKGYEVHHLIEKRFASTLGMKTNDMLSVALDKETHKKITKLMREYIPYNSIFKGMDSLTTSTATEQDIWDALRKVYTHEDVNMPMYLDYLQEELMAAGFNLNWGSW